MKKFMLFILGLVAVLFVTGCSNQTIKYRKPLTRDVSLISKQIDYQSFFNDFTKQEVVLDKNKNTVQFKATKEVDASLFEDVDFVNYSTNKDKVEFDYDVKYDANSNEFTLSITANAENGKVIDNWKGTPFVDEKGDVDIAFSTDDGVVYLSDLEDSGIINECGWFSRLFKKIAVVAAVVAVVAVVVAVAVVATPVVAAAGTAFTAAASGGVVALSAGSAASAMAVAATTAVASTAFAVATTTAAIATLTAGISCAVSEISYSIETYNRTASYDNVIAESLIQSVVKEATKENFKDDDSMDNRVVYLGRNPEYYNISRRDRVNKKFVFHLTDSRWEYLHNKYTDSAMWIFNKAFLTYALKKEKTHNWKFRLVTEYRNYSNIIPFGKPGCFYSRELKYLRDTNHYFSSYRTYMNYGSFYQVW